MPILGAAVAATYGSVMTYTADQILNGSFVTYDPVTAAVMTASDALRPVVAYEAEGKLLSDEEGPLRVVFLTPLGAGGRGVPVGQVGGGDPS
jgi:hypothetical protein